MISVSGATADEVAAVAAAIAAVTQETTEAPLPERLSAWKRANREPDLTIEELRTAGGAFVA
ncbi:MAG TPA: hypothetical protein VGN11_08935 [Candidatus Baltobacteraceae bacterium]|nr:hypothetical protein [Candidatus Baltobacteraceae bacterium]